MSTASGQTLIDPPVRLVHRLAMLCVGLVWPLIWVGGLVTTYDAGMAVPDWPGTYGYNLFLYPYKTWLLGPFDLFIEHGHRLLGAVVGMVAIATAVAAYFLEPRRWVFYLTLGLLAAVIAQGLLGGMRVVLGDRTLAMIHGCFGPAFFAFCVATMAVTSRHWWDAAAADDQSRQRRPGSLAVALTVALVAISYAQLVLGAMLRHVQPTASASGFAAIVSLHITMAVGLWLATAGTWWHLRRCGDLTLSRPGACLLGLVALQILLGVGTWVVNYGWPSFLLWVPGSTGFLLRAKGFLDSIIVTAHVATGSLILAVSTWLWVRTARVRSQRRQAVMMRPQSDAAQSTTTGSAGRTMPATATISS